MNLANCQSNTLKSPHIVEEDTNEPVQEEEVHGTNQHITQKINSRSASFHFSINAGDGYNVGGGGDTHNPNALNAFDLGSPSQVKTVR